MVAIFSHKLIHVWYSQNFRVRSSYFSSTYSIRWGIWRIQVSLMTCLLYAHYVRHIFCTHIQDHAPLLICQCHLTLKCRDQSLHWLLWWFIHEIHFNFDPLKRSAMFTYHQTVGCIVWTSSSFLGIRYLSHSLSLDRMFCLYTASRRCHHNQLKLLSQLNQQKLYWPICWVDEGGCWCG